MLPAAASCGIVSGVKALKSPLAKAVLADPKASQQLRAFLASKSEQDPRHATVIEVNFEGRTLRVKPVVVPKAA